MVKHDVTSYDEEAHKLRVFFVEVRRPIQIVEINASPLLTRDATYGGQQKRDDDDVMRRHCDSDVRDQSCEGPSLMCRSKLCTVRAVLFQVGTPSITPRFATNIEISCWNSQHVSYLPWLEPQRYARYARQRRMYVGAFFKADRSLHNPVTASTIMPAHSFEGWNLELYQ